MVSITGDELSVGAEIYVDGVHIGTMEKRIHDATSLYSNPGDIFASANIQAPDGKHEFLFISVDQKIIRKKLTVRNENYWDINFYKLTIRDN